jgi:hypothetical protein
MKMKWSLMLTCFLLPHSCIFGASGSREYNEFLYANKSNDGNSTFYYIKNNELINNIKYVNNFSLLYNRISLLN